MQDRLLVATRKGLFTLRRTRPAATPWAIAKVDFLGDPVSAVLSDPRDGALYAALDHGHFGSKLHRSRDAGATWEACAVPAYPPLPEGSPPEVNPISGQPIPWTLRLIWSLEAGGADQPGVLWCGTTPGGLFRSADGGTSWEIVRSLWDRPERRKWMGGGMDAAGIHSICVDPRDSRRVGVGVSCGGVWATDDGGANWECRAKGMRAAYMPPELQGDPNAQDPHRVVQCRANPDSLWAQHHNGIFRTTDAAASWREIDGVEPSTFGFAVAVHPHDGETAWFVPANSDQRRVPLDGKVVVTRTRDGGKSFQALRQGLPQEHAYDIVYRHALDVDGTGDRLAFGSTTGSLWVSEDSGESWSGVNAHFPPVYAVRFG